MTDFAAGPFTRQLWQDASATIDTIEQLPFLQELLNGQLDPAVFTFYILQDDLYLAGYAQSMALLSAKAPLQDERRFWAHAVIDAIQAEEEMHRSMLQDPHLAAARQTLAAHIAQNQPSPTTLGYVSFLRASTALQSYAVGVAAILPCFWVYAHVGKVLAGHLPAIAADHPYRTWIAMYDSPLFDTATRKAVNVLERVMEASNDGERAAMRTAFLQSCTYEWHFWHAAHVMQGWDLPPTA